jgi:hypothetical protein
MSTDHNCACHLLHFQDGCHILRVVQGWVSQQYSSCCNWSSRQPFRLDSFVDISVPTDVHARYFFNCTPHNTLLVHCDVPNFQAGTLLTSRTLCIILPSNYSDQQLHIKQLKIICNIKFLHIAVPGCHLQEIQSTYIGQF